MRSSLQCKFGFYGRFWMAYRSDMRDQIGRFLKVLGNIFYKKSSPNIWKTVMTFWGASPLKQKTLLCLNFCNIWRNWATLYSTIWSHRLFVLGTIWLILKTQLYIDHCKVIVLTIFQKLSYHKNYQKLAQMTKKWS